ncbi:MAG: hypothetical protein AAB215_03785 [Planctomycetota bacterium]
MTTSASGGVWASRRFWWHLTQSELRARFRNSRLGALWCIVPPLALAVIVSAIMSTVFRTPAWKYFVFVLTGLVAWEFILGAVVLGASAIVNAEAYIRQRALPLSIYPLKVVLANLFVLALSSLACAAAALAADGGTRLWPFLAALPVSLALMFLFALPCAIIGALLQARFRDYAAMMAIAMQAVYFLSPVFITRQTFLDAGLAPLLQWNPLAALLACFRMPFEGIWPSALDIGIAWAFVALLWALAWVSLRRWGPRTVFYL